ncbi:MAG: FHA domain-containing protein [Microthrixaceae bacterium]
MGGSEGATGSSRGGAAGGREPTGEHTASIPTVAWGDVDHRPAPMLVVIRGANAGSRFVIERELTTVGRHPESDVFLDDVTVSRRHAVLRREDDGFVVEDVGSLNGTYLNGDRVNSRALNEGDQLQIGKFRMVFATGVFHGD